MKVGELIEILEEWNPDDEVAIMVGHYMYSPSYESEKREVIAFYGEDYGTVTLRLVHQLGGVGELIGSEQNEDEIVAARTKEI